jgi:hypothetical protein
MLATAMEKAREDGTERVRVLHISPAGNRDLHRITSARIGDVTGQTDAFEAFTALLATPEDGVARFVQAYSEDVFGPELRRDPQGTWAAYLLDRYDFLARTQA